MAKLSLKQRISNFWENLCNNSGGINTIIAIITLAVAIIALT